MGIVLVATEWHAKRNEYCIQYAKEVFLCSLYLSGPATQQQQTILPGQEASDSGYQPMASQAAEPADIAANQQMVVIGAGVIGLVTACRLQQQGHQVLLLDGNGIGQGCSFGNAGHLATEQVFPLADPALLPKLPGFLLDPLGPLAIRPRYFFKAIPFFLRFINQNAAKPGAAPTL